MNYYECSNGHRSTVDLPKCGACGASVASSVSGIATNQLPAAQNSSNAKRPKFSIPKFGYFFAAVCLGGISIGLANQFLGQADPNITSAQPIIETSNPSELVGTTSSSSLSTSAEPTPEPNLISPGEPLVGPFVIARVLSADTFDLIDREGSIKRIRLIGIDAPAESESSDFQQCGGSDALIAANYAFNYPDIEVMLEPDSAWPKTDEVGNEYFYLWVEEELFSIELLENGNAVEYAKYGPYRHQEAHLTAQAQADGSEGSGLLGIWKDCPSNSGAGAGFGAAKDGDSNNLRIIPFFVGDKEETVECHPSYIGVCLNPNVADYNCGSAPFLVIGPDVYRLDRDNDGVACES